MTADLFIKLSAKLYSESAREPSLEEEELLTPSEEAVKSDHFGTDSCPSDEEYDSSESNGGVPLNPPNTDENFSSNLVENLPPAWHAAQLNPLLTIAGSNDSAGGTGIIQQWVPGPDSWFWQVYGNQLRVNSVEGGVCRLSLVGT